MPLRTLVSVFVCLNFLVQRSELLAERAKREGEKQQTWQGTLKALAQLGISPLLIIN